MRSTLGEPARNEKESQGGVDSRSKEQNTDAAKSMCRRVMACNLLRVRSCGNAGLLFQLHARLPHVIGQTCLGTADEQDGNNLVHLLETGLVLFKTCMAVIDVPTRTCLGGRFPCGHSWRIRNRVHAAPFCLPCTPTCASSRARRVWRAHFACDFAVAQPAASAHARCNSVVDLCKVRVGRSVMYCHVKLAWYDVHVTVHDRNQSQHAMPLQQGPNVAADMCLGFLAHCPACAILMQPASWSLQGHASLASSLSTTCASCVLPVPGECDGPANGVKNSTLSLHRCSAGT